MGGANDDVLARSSICGGDGQREGGARHRVTTEDLGGPGTVAEPETLVQFVGVLIDGTLAVVAGCGAVGGGWIAQLAFVSLAQRVAEKSLGTASWGVGSGLLTATLMGSWKVERMLGSKKAAVGASAGQDPQEF